MEKIPARDKILAKAIEMFNESAIEYIGMRELAASLDMRIGNITYYFPTKDDLVNEISLLHSAGNDKILVKKDGITPGEFLDMLEQAFAHQYKYRCIFMSMVHLLEQNPIIAKRYKTVQQGRVSVQLYNLNELIKGKYIAAGKKECEALASNIVLIARFWISETRISRRVLGVERKSLFFLEMIATLMMRFSTAKGKKSLTLWMEERGV